MDGTVGSVSEANGLEASVATVGDEEVVCVAKLAQNVFDGHHVHGSQQSAERIGGRVRRTS